MGILPARASTNATSPKAHFELNRNWGMHKHKSAMQVLFLFRYLYAAAASFRQADYTSR
jgi:hypothetical protein